MPSTLDRDPGPDTRPRTAPGTGPHLVCTPLTPLLMTSVSRDSRPADTTLLRSRQEVAREPQDRSWLCSGHPRVELFRAQAETPRHDPRTRRNALLPQRSAGRPRPELSRATSCGPPFLRP